MTPQDLRTLKTLYAMMYQESKRKYPDHPLTPKPFKIVKTSQLEAAVEKLFHLYGYKSVRRTHVQGRKIGSDSITYNVITGKRQTLDKAKYIPTTGRKGEADIHGNIILRQDSIELAKRGLMFASGISLAIEIKNQYTHDQIRPEQLRYKEDFEADGGLYLVIRSITEAMEWIDQNLEKKIYY